jgi:hypothetical protein
MPRIRFSIKFSGYLQPTFNSSGVCDGLRRTNQQAESASAPENFASLFSRFQQIKGKN